MSKPIERRYMRETQKLETRESDNGEKIISGYAAVFNRRSQEMWGMFEVVDPAAFNKTLSDGADVRGLFNHDPNLILGRTKAGTLHLSTDDVGLRYQITLPNTRAGLDAWESIQRGDVDGSSFGFQIVKDEWSYNRDTDEVVRTLKEVRLFDVSPVVFPAYPDTSAEARSADIVQKVQQLRAESRTTPEPAEATHGAGTLVHSWRNTWTDVI